MPALQRDVAGGNLGGVMLIGAALLLSIVVAL